MLALTVSSKLEWGSYIIFIAKTATKKIGALIHSMKFLSPEVTLYLYKSTFRPCMECMSWLVLLFATWNCWKSYKNRYAGLLVIHLLPLLTPWLIIEPLADSIGITLLDVHLNWLNWFHFLILEGDLLVFCHHTEMLQGCLYKDFFPLHS